MHTWTNPFLILFIVLPPIAILYDWKGNGKYKLQSLFYLYILVGYILINVAIYYYHSRLGAYLQTLDNPPPDLMHNWAADGAKKLFGFAFGWVYALIYFSVWRLLYLLIRKLFSIKLKTS